MIQEQRKFLAIVLLIAFGFAGERLYKFYYEHAPIVKVGECIEIVPTNHRYVGKVTSNDFDNGSCTVETNVYGLTSVDEYDYKLLRDLDARKVPCNEKAN